MRLEQHADAVGFRMLMDDDALTKVSAEGCNDSRNPKGAIEPFELGDNESVSPNHGWPSIGKHVYLKIRRGNPVSSVLSLPDLLSIL